MYKTNDLMYKMNYREPSRFDLRKDLRADLILCRMRRRRRSQLEGCDSVTRLCGEDLVRLSEDCVVEDYADYEEFED